MQNDICHFYNFYNWMLPSLIKKSVKNKLTCHWNMIRLSDIWTTCLSFCQRQFLCFLVYSCCFFLFLPSTLLVCSCSFCCSLCFLCKITEYMCTHKTAVSHQWINCSVPCYEVMALLQAPHHWGLCGALVVWGRDKELKPCTAFNYPGSAWLCTCCRVEKGQPQRDPTAPWTSRGRLQRIIVNIMSI